MTCEIVARSSGKLARLFSDYTPLSTGISVGSHIRDTMRIVFRAKNYQSRIPRQFCPLCLYICGRWSRNFPSTSIPRSNSVGTIDTEVCNAIIAMCKRRLTGSCRVKCNVDADVSTRASRRNGARNASARLARMGASSLPSTIFSHRCASLAAFLTRGTEARRPYRPRRARTRYTRK